jgi:hypothetical protein
MKTKENVFNAEKQPENRNSREFKSFSKESSEEDQSSIIDEHSFRNKGLKPDNDPRRKNLPGYSKQAGKNPSYSFVVDWQIPESSE